MLGCEIRVDESVPAGVEMMMMMMMMMEA